MKHSFFIYFILLIIVGSGCAPYLHQPLVPQEARLGADLPITQKIGELPQPKEKIVASVYKFRDQTGQYKPSENGANWSTAVTQGATSILLRALEESDWFVPLERENLGNLLNERKIIRSSRAEYLKGEQEAPVLPPLLYAGIILEGGIISYDANVVTGGAGLRYFGTGGSGQYREDRVTIYLRAISTSNGRILKTVYTSRTILSQMVDVGVFKFVKFKQLFEAETGFTYNEPTEIAVKDAIEKAVHSLILEGIEDNLWEASLNDPTADNILKAYKEEKEMNQNIDIHDRLQVPRRGNLTLGVNGSGFIYAGDYKNSVTEPGFTFSVGLNPKGNWGYLLDVGAGELSTEVLYNSSIVFAEFLSVYRVYPQDKYTPWFQIGGGLVAKRNGRVFDFKVDNLMPELIGGAGFEYLASDKLGVNIGAKYHYLFSEDLDNVDQGNFNDAFWSVSFGLNFYF